jgi:hypothetical protein
LAALRLQGLRRRWWCRRGILLQVMNQRGRLRFGG